MKISFCWAEYIKYRGASPIKPVVKVINETKATKAGLKNLTPPIDGVQFSIKKGAVALAFENIANAAATFFVRLT